MKVKKKLDWSFFSRNYFSINFFSIFFVWKNFIKNFYLQKILWLIKFTNFCFSSQLWKSNPFKKQYEIKWIILFFQKKQTWLSINKNKSNHMTVSHRLETFFLLFLVFLWIEDSIVLPFSHCFGCEAYIVSVFSPKLKIPSGLISAGSVSGWNTIEAIGLVLNLSNFSNRLFGFAPRLCWSFVFEEVEEYKLEDCIFVKFSLIIGLNSFTFSGLASEKKFWNLLLTKASVATKSTVFIFVSEALRLLNS